MRLVGLAGPARSGKDTVAQHLVAEHGFRQFSFSDALYEEVSKAFRVSIEFLQDARIKDTSRPEMFLRECFDQDFIDVAIGVLRREQTFSTQVLSPRWILQTWGTEYRRAQDPDYWIKRADEWLDDSITWGFDRFVNSSTRYPNESEWIRSIGGEVWHISRPNCPLVRAHSSEIPLPVHPGDKMLVNAATIEDLRQAATRLLEPDVTSAARFGPTEGVAA